jgi:uncharacterized protein with PIN domain
VAKFYADEQFPKKTSEALRVLGHDVLTTQEANNANQGIADSEVLAYAIARDRAVLTINRQDFIKLHKSSSQHTGIIVCTENPDFIRLAEKIHIAVIQLDSLNDRLIRICRDN